MTTATIQIEEYEQYQINDGAMASAFDLWWSDWEEAGVERCYLALDEDCDIIGFQTVNGDGLCVAIEVKPDFQGKGIGSMLVEESNCWKPERNECPEFWAAMEEKFGC